MSLNTLLIYQLQQVFQHTVKINRKKRLFEFFLKHQWSVCIQDQVQCTWLRFKVGHNFKHDTRM